MASCIYCDAEADSGEHWMPKTFGTFRNFEQLFHRLCTDCNKALGDELDQEVANTGTTALAKAHLGIEGRHKGTPSKNPFQYRVMGVEAATTVLVKSPDGTHSVLGEFFKTESGETRLIQARQLVFKKADGAIVPVHFPRAYTADLLKKLLKVRGVEGATPFEMYLEKDESHEDEALKALVREAVGGPYSVMAFGGIGESAGRQDFVIQSNISLAYLRGIAKIAFHCYLKMSDAHTGAELLFQPLRRFIRYGEGDPDNFVILMGPHFIEAFAKGESPDSFCHFLAFYKFDSFLTAVVQLFVGPDHVTYPSLVLLGISQKGVKHRVHQFTYFDAKTDNYDGELVEIPDVTLVRVK